MLHSEASSDASRFMWAQTPLKNKNAVYAHCYFFRMLVEGMSEFSEGEEKDTKSTAEEQLCTLNGGSLNK